MSNQTLITELTPLLEALCEDRLTRGETARLERLVLSSAEARWFYLSYVDLHGSLYWDAAGVGSATALSSDEVPVWTEVAKAPAETAPAEVAAPRKRSHRGRLVAAVSVAACLCVGVIAWFAANGPAKSNQLAVTPADSHRAVQTADGTPVKDSESPSIPRHRGPAVEIAIVDQTPSTTVVPEPTKSLVTVVPAPPEPQREELDSHQVVAAINTEIRRGWEIAEVQPSAVADDAEWLRRVSLDLSGRIPTVDEAESFLANTRPGKREQLIDQLLDDTAYARNFTTIWTNLLVGRRSEQRVDRGALRKFLRMSFAANRPWNQIVYDLVAAEGSSSENGATNFLIAHLNNDALPATAVTARVFLGQQMQCNQCHDNPFTKTQQTAFWELHSFFSQTASVPRHERDPRTGKDHYAFTELVTRDAGGPIYFETQNGLMRVAYPRFNGHDVDPGPETNRRAVLARLMTEGDQPQLAAAFVNRLWSHFFGEGFTPAVDNIGPHSPASHPELLALLTQQFVRSGYDTKQLVRWICNSEPYQLSSRVSNANRTDEPIEGQSPQFSHMYVKSMTAEQMYDSFLVATKAHRAGGVDWTQAESHRQQWLSQFVVNYETDENEEAMEFDGTMSQALTLMNGSLVEKALEISPGTLLDEVVRRKADEKEKIRQLCLAALSRLPTPNELVAMRKLVRDDSPGRGPKNTGRSVASAEGYQDLFWALLNSNEFALVH
ncbi:MAG: DUF1549 domain-containing protein [Planctomycetota bacterium]